MPNDRTEEYGILFTEVVLMRFRLIAADLDDTLLDENSEISSRSREAIRKAVAQGVKFVIATGRMFKTSITFMADLGLNSDSPLINYHGALIKKAQSKEIIFHRPLKNSLAVALAEEAERRNCHVSVFIDDELYISEDSEYSRYYQNLAKIDSRKVGSLSAFLINCGAAPSKMSIIRWDGTIDDLESDFRDSFGDKLSILQSRPYFLEITDRRATKGQALRWLAEQEGIRPEEVIAFGDGHNDLDMLRYAGMGVAVANARPAVLAVADLVADTNSDDGVAKVIEKYVLDQSDCTVIKSSE
jgi:Cof subfamily protein (haloacid dehalogenase superfamily)